MTRTFKALSALLSYPTADMQVAVPEFTEAIDREALLPTAIRRQLDLLLNEIATGDLYDLQERYVLLFDRTRSLSLHLFEHVHGESRDRGQAMIDLKALYETGGLEIDAAELPDFIPLFLEFLSTRPRREAYNLLAQPAHVLATMAERLRKRQSAYEAVFRALVQLAAAKPKADIVSALLAEPDPDANDLAALDAAWEDEPVYFGPNANSGCKDTLIEKIRAGRRPAPGMPQAQPRPVMPRS
jgi:nitrate reductase molybdenum cofactor assembly chaperone NarJ/NarW